jgi:hypothetical protein
LHNIHLNFYLICLSRTSIFVVAMDFCYHSCAEMDLATLHYVAFIEPFDVLPKDPM